MAVNRKHRAVEGADPERWALLGLRLRARRIELGYPVRKAFARARGLMTDKGAPNVRMINAMENNERPGTYAPGRLEQFARAYEVTAESVYALLDGKTDELEPARPPAPAPLAAPRLPSAPPSGLLREEDARPYFIPVYDRVLRQADQGNPDPTGADLGLPPDLADVWDATAGRMSRGDRAWTVAEVQRREAARREAGNADATSA